MTVPSANMSWKDQCNQTDGTTGTLNNFYHLGYVQVQEPKHFMKKNYIENL